MIILWAKVHIEQYSIYLPIRAAGAGGFASGSVAAGIVFV